MECHLAKSGQREGSEPVLYSLAEGRAPAPKHSLAGCCAAITTLAMRNKLGSVSPDCLRRRPLGGRESTGMPQMRQTGYRAALNAECAGARSPSHELRSKLSLSELTWHWGQSSSHGWPLPCTTTSGDCDEETCHGVHSRVDTAGGSGLGDR